MIRGARRLRIVVLALGALVVLLGPLLSLQHKAAERHATCEHGAEIHIGTAGVDVAVDDHGTQGRDAARPSPGEPPAHEDHHHCSVITTAPAVAGDGGPALAATRLAALAAPHSIPDDAPHGRAVLANAPKTSPPA